MMHLSAGYTGAAGKAPSGSSIYDWESMGEFNPFYLSTRGFKGAENTSLLRDAKYPVTCSRESTVVIAAPLHQMEIL